MPGQPGTRRTGGDPHASDPLRPAFQRHAATGTAMTAAATSTLPILSVVVRIVIRPTHTSPVVN